MSKLIVPFKFIVNTSDIVNLYYVYKITDGETVLYIGVIDGRNLLTIGDVLANRYVKDHIVKLPYVLVDVISAYDSLYDAKSASVMLISKHRPICNQYGKIGVRRAKKVVCIETGQVFDTVTKAAKSADVSVSTMSNHLRRRSGYKTIRDHTYEFADMTK